MTLVLQSAWLGIKHAIHVKLGHFVKQCRSGKKVSSVELSIDRSVDRYQFTFSCKSWRPTFNGGKLENIVGGVLQATLVDSG